MNIFIFEFMRGFVGLYSTLFNAISIVFKELLVTLFEPTILSAIGYICGIFTAFLLPTIIILIFKRKK